MPDMSITGWWRVLSCSPQDLQRGKPLNSTSLSVEQEGVKFKDNLVFILDPVGNFSQALTLFLFI